MRRFKHHPSALGLILPRQLRLGRLVVLILCVSAGVTFADSDDAGIRSDETEPPISKADREKLETELTARLASAGKAVEAKSDVRSHSTRGDLRFFLGQFSESVADYDRMIELEPAQKESHWRRGIALFFAGEFEPATAQFDAYHSYDDVDRENGIWRFLCRYRASGAEAARKELLKYEKDDREPFPAVYKLFEGTLTTEQLIESVPDQLPDAELQKRMFYVELYAGLFEAVEGRTDTAIRHLRRATANQWPQSAGYGPHYMWHVGRLEYERLAAETKKEP